MKLLIEKKMVVKRKKTQQYEDEKAKKSLAIGNKNVSVQTSIGRKSFKKTQNSEWIIIFHCLNT
jgi:hypothetical protein